MVAKIGLEVMMMAALMGEVKFKPLKKKSWFKVTPNTAHRAMYSKSRHATRSL